MSMTAKDKANAQASDRERQERLALALRENLKRRKAQAREAKHKPGDRGD